MLDLSHISEYGPSALLQRDIMASFHTVLILMTLPHICSAKYENTSISSISSSTDNVNANNFSIISELSSNVPNKKSTDGIITRNATSGTPVESTKNSSGSYVEKTSDSKSCFEDEAVLTDISMSTVATIDRVGNDNGTTVKNISCAVVSDNVSDKLCKNIKNIKPAKSNTDISKKMWLYGSPFILAVGTIGNSMSIFVMLRKRFRKNTICFYLILLAIVDTCVLYVGLLPHLINSITTEKIEHMSEAACKMRRFMTYFTSHLDSWIMVCLTIERAAAVLFPYKYKDWFTKMRAAVSLAFIAMVLFSVDLHFFWTHQLNEYRIASRNKMVTKKYCWVAIKQHMWFMTVVWPWLDMALFSLIPFVFLIVGNSAICVKLMQVHISIYFTLIR